uniref:F-box domain-containing protein n=1 Tax=Meloidogyne enterolobii TaxID=390850 RepID=A0A6V7XM83_MELEN|nr:unnamed protein product [Meloidogyne enterolobii]
MFYSLPTETKLDIFKYLSYKELFSIKQTNLYFRDFIDKYEGELAREKVFTIHFDHTINQFKKDLHRLNKPKSENFDFPLSEQLEEKINKLKYAKGFCPFLKKNGLKNPIPFYLPYQNSKNIVSHLSKRGEILFNKFSRASQYSTSKILKLTPFINPIHLLTLATSVVTLLKWRAIVQESTNPRFSKQ